MNFLFDKIKNFLPLILRCFDFAEEKIAHGPAYRAPLIIQPAIGAIEKFSPHNHVFLKEVFTYLVRVFLF